MRGEIMVFLTIKWDEEDVREALINAGKECTEENIQIVMSQENVRYIEERSIEFGWEMLNNLAECI